MLPYAWLGCFDGYGTCCGAHVGYVEYDLDADEISCALLAIDFFGYLGTGAPEWDTPTFTHIDGNCWHPMRQPTCGDGTQFGLTDWVDCLAQEWHGDKEELRIESELPGSACGGPVWGTSPWLFVSGALADVYLKPVEGECLVCADDTGKPSASFTVTPLGGCRFKLTNTSTAGSTPIIRCLWMDGSTDCDEIIVNLRHVNCEDGGPDEITGEALLVVVDENGCYDVATAELECGCSCASSGTLTVTELDDCQFRLAASITGDAECVDGSFIEWQLVGSDCPDGDCNPCFAFDENGDPAAPEGCTSGCFGSLGDGDHHDLTISGPRTLRWRHRTCACDCPEEWTEVELPCSNCDCCTQAISGVTVTLDGWAAGDGCMGADCDLTINGDYALTYVGSCIWGTVVGPYGPEECQNTITINLTINCSVPGELEVSLSVITAGSVLFRKVIAIGAPPVDCEAAGIGGSLPKFSFTGTDCDTSGATASVEFSFDDG
ncbi:MAG: hypothetical protein IT424_06450 [Pirellulales bacterium]|nr:hypothetical protein [Pirellulales bacterium]